LFVVQDEESDHLPKPSDCSGICPIPAGGQALALACALSNGDAPGFARTWRSGFDEWDDENREPILKGGLLAEFQPEESVIHAIRRGILSRCELRILKPLVQSRMLTYALLYARRHGLTLGKFNLDQALGEKDAWKAPVQALFRGLAEPKVTCKGQPPNMLGVAINDVVVKLGNCAVSVGDKDTAAGKERVGKYGIAI
jgi:hypothetical protein